MSNYLKYIIMAKRKEVKINEEQIRDMMTGDIPAVFMEKIMETTLPTPPKKVARNQKRKINPGFLPYQTKWKIPAYLPVKKYRPRSSERKHARKGTACRIIPNICLITTL